MKYKSISFSIYVYNFVQYIRLNNIYMSVYMITCQIAYIAIIQSRTKKIINSDPFAHIIVYLPNRAAYTSESLERFTNKNIRNVQPIFCNPFKNIHIPRSRKSIENQLFIQAFSHSISLSSHLRLLMFIKSKPTCTKRGSSAWQ